MLRFSDKPLKVGDKASIHGGYSRGPDLVVTITAMTDRKITTSDGKSWNAYDGRLWGNSRDRWYNGLTLHHYQDGDEQKIWRKRALQRLSRISEWDKYTDDELALILGVLVNAEKRIKSAQQDVTK